MKLSTAVAIVGIAAAACSPAPRAAPPAAMPAMAAMAATRAPAAAPVAPEAAPPDPAAAHPTEARASETAAGTAAGAAAGAAVPPVDFQSQILPILETRCQPCHFSGGKMYARLPFDRPATLYLLGTKLFTRIRDEEEQALLRAFLDQPADG